MLVWWELQGPSADTTWLCAAWGISLHSCCLGIAVCSEKLLPAPKGRQNLWHWSLGAGTLLYLPLVAQRTNFQLRMRYFILPFPLCSKKEQKPALWAGWCEFKMVFWDLRSLDDEEGGQKMRVRWASGHF